MVQEIKHPSAFARKLGKILKKQLKADGALLVAVTVTDAGMSMQLAAPPSCGSSMAPRPWPAR